LIEARSIEGIRILPTDEAHLAASINVDIDFLPERNMFASFISVRMPGILLGTFADSQRVGEST
jgi:hypothetical protein